MKTKPTLPSTGKRTKRPLKRVVRGLATLKKPIFGHFSRWKEGEIVKVRFVPGTGYACIEKLKRKPSGVLKEGLPILNELAGVPREYLQMHKSSNDPSSATA